MSDFQVYMKRIYESNGNQGTIPFWRQYDKATGKGEKKAPLRQPIRRHTRAEGFTGSTIGKRTVAQTDQQNNRGRLTRRGRLRDTDIRLWVALS
jgi:hypothetical protein